MNTQVWTINETAFDPNAQHHKETIFTIGNGYLCTRGAFEEGHLNERRATFIHGVFDDAPLVFSELANAPDWLWLQINLNGERFTLDQGTIQKFERFLDLQSGVLTRTVSWRSPSGQEVDIHFERFASLADEHLLYLRCQITPKFDGTVEVRAALTGYSDNEGLAHWRLLEQGLFENKVAYLVTQTRASQIKLAAGMRVRTSPRAHVEFWDAPNAPTFNLTFSARNGKTITVDKIVGIATARDTDDPLKLALEKVANAPAWNKALAQQEQAWAEEWKRSDILIEGDDESQLAVRFSLFQLLIAAPRHANNVNIGAKTLSGFGYRGHSFWDTEIFMLPVFIYTAPHIARNLLEYRYQRLPGAREKARANGFEGAQFPWESADSGEEVTPTWVPHYEDRTKQIRIWTGDIEIHISADVAYAAHLYWRVSGDDTWFIEKGAELVLDTAKFWAARVEWNAETNHYEINDVIGPDEYHDHVDNNFYTNYMARWNLKTALDVLGWLKQTAPAKADELTQRLDLTPEQLARWIDVINRIFLSVQPDGLIEQFQSYFQRKDIELASLEPRSISAQALFGIEGCNETQILKQPDVLILQYLLRKDFTDEQVRLNYDYYNLRTDHTYGSSLGPSIQAIMACEAGQFDDAYEHFMRSARADLTDVRGNAQDGIHGASAGGTWQAVVFGFAGLQVHEVGWEARPRLPKHWKRLKFNFYQRGELQTVDVKQ